MKPRLTYSNVVATMALFVALGGSSYAAVKISGSKLKNRSVAAKKVKRDALGGTEVNESKLAQVPRRARRTGSTGSTRRI